MGPRDLLARLRRLAKKNRWSFDKREGANHTIVRVNGRSTAVPRHGRDIGPGLLKKIIETDLGLKQTDVRDA